MPHAQRPPALSVGELTRRIKGTLEDGFREVWVEGEMGKVTVHQSGHVYFTLKDAEARIDGVVWRTTEWRLRYKPNPGDRVVARGSLSVHAARGAYSLIVDLFLPAGAGDMQAAFEQLKRKLQAEGLFDPARKKSIPFLPRAVGVVTSATGAARHDIETVLHRRAPQIPIVLYPAQVQGEGAAADVARGIAELDWDPRVDVIIVGRGGGSLEDLWTFNEEDVARAIAACTTPVISAVGHESDITIADLVADLRAATPSEAAEKAVPNRSDLLYTLDGLLERLGRAVERRVEQSRFRLDTLHRRARVDLAFKARAAVLDRLATRLDRALRRRLDAERTGLRRLEATLRERHPAERIHHARRRADLLDARLDHAAQALIGAAQLRLQLLAARLHALSPLAGLERGFSVTRREDRVIRDAAQVAPGDDVEILLHRGRLRARVTEVHSPSPEEIP